MDNALLRYKKPSQKKRKSYPYEELSDVGDWIPPHEDGAVLELSPSSEESDTEGQETPSKKKQKANGRQTTNRRESRGDGRVSDGDQSGYNTRSKAKINAAKKQKSSPEQTGNKKGKLPKRPRSHSESKGQNASDGQVTDAKRKKPVQDDSVPNTPEKTGIAKRSTPNRPKAKVQPRQTARQDSTVEPAGNNKGKPAKRSRSQSSGAEGQNGTDGEEHGAKRKRTETDRTTQDVTDPQLTRRSPSVEQSEGPEEAREDRPKAKISKEAIAETVQDDSVLNTPAKTETVKKNTPVKPKVQPRQIEKRPNSKTEETKKPRNLWKRIKFIRKVLKKEDNRKTCGKCTGFLRETFHRNSTVILCKRPNCKDRINHDPDK